MRENNSFPVVATYQGLLVTREGRGFVVFWYHENIQVCFALLHRYYRCLDTKSLRGGSSQTYGYGTPKVLGGIEARCGPA